MHLGATELFHSVTPTGSSYIYSHGQNFGNFSEPTQQLALPSWSPDHLLIASSLLSLVTAAVAAVASPPPS